MSVKVTVEGGSEFELTDREVQALRSYDGNGAINCKLRDALPSLPYMPFDGERVQYRIPGVVYWSQFTNTIFDGWHKGNAVIRLGVHHLVLQDGVEFRPDTRPIEPTP